MSNSNSYCPTRLLCSTCTDTDDYSCEWCPSSESDNETNGSCGPLGTYSVGGACDYKVVSLESQCSSGNKFSLPNNIATVVSGLVSVGILMAIAFYCRRRQMTNQLIAHQNANPRHQAIMAAEAPTAPVGSITYTYGAQNNQNQHRLISRPPPPPPSPPPPSYAETQMMDQNQPTLTTAYNVNTTNNNNHSNSIYAEAYVLPDGHQSDNRHSHSTAEELEKLHSLYVKGILNEYEYNNAKQKILNR